MVYGGPPPYVFVFIAFIAVGGVFTVGCAIWICCMKFRMNLRNGYYGPSVTTVTTTQHAQSPQINPPYPIDPRHPTPGGNITGYGSQAPYPQHTPNMPFPQTGNTPYPPAGPTPYPPQPYQQTTHDYSANPPPYDVAVSQPPLQPPPSKEGYVKQSPYNPGYN